jgi:hypothetical protein
VNGVTCSLPRPSHPNRSHTRMRRKEQLSLVQPWIELPHARGLRVRSCGVPKCDAGDERRLGRPPFLHPPFFTAGGSAAGWQSPRSTDRGSRRRQWLPRPQLVPPCAVKTDASALPEPPVTKTRMWALTVGCKSILKLLEDRHRGRHCGGPGHWYVSLRSRNRGGFSWIIRRG